jgi:DNA-binding transcriptional ArsR family regulator
MEAAELDATFFALSSGFRRRMLDVLKREGGCSVSRVCEFFAAEVGRHAVMKHLAALERGGTERAFSPGGDEEAQAVSRLEVRCKLADLQIFRVL